MKRLLPFILLFWYGQLVNAQKKLNSNEVRKSVTNNNQQHPSNQPNPGPGPGPRCATDANLQLLTNKYPSYLQTIKQANQLLNEQVKMRLERQLLPNGIASGGGPVLIPVVVHIVSLNPALITNAQVQQQLDRLNLDFSGLNPDSTNLTPMFPYSLRGHSRLKFVLAKKDPGNNPTTGIERRCSNTGFDGSDRDPIKRADQGGLDSWDPSNYLNIWVGNTSLDGVLGYATYPYSVAGYVKPPKEFDGVVIRTEAFGNNTSLYTANRGRTLVHEMGHFFGLMHIFQGGCKNEDFSISAFDTGNTDDTPAQFAGTGYGATGENSCPSGSVSSGCASNPSSRLFQNYMDYTDDPCMSMFTANQVTRMETALDLFLPTLKTSTAATAPVVRAKDLQAVSTIGPNAGNPSFLPCNSKLDNLNFCSNQELYYIAPAVTVRNTGSDPITRLEIWYRIGSEAAMLNKKLTLPAAIGSMDTVTIPLEPIALRNGANDLLFFTSNPDDMADENPVNDTLHLLLEMSLPDSLPVTEDFEGDQFPSPGWKKINHDQDHYTWQKSQAGSKSGQASAFINFFDYDMPGRIDDLVTPVLDVAFADSIILSFESAYKQFDNTATEFSDSLEILVSEDCGQSYKTVWKRGGSSLASVPGSTGLVSWTPAASDWKRIQIDLRSMVSTSTQALRVIFRGKNGYGQNLFLDDISLHAVIQPITDAGIVTAASPGNRICHGAFRPSLVITNFGVDTLKKLSVNYSIDGGAVQTLTWLGKLRKFSQETVAFDEVSLTTGVHHIRFFIHSPNDLLDEKSSNDSLAWRVMVLNEVNAPVNQGFESATFPPLHWDTAGAGSHYQWQKSSHAASGGSASMWVNNNSNTIRGSRQDLYTPLIKVDKADSIVVSFDLAHVTKEYPIGISPTDTLQVLLTLDCGKTFTSVYKKWGPQINTMNSAYPGTVTRDSIGFVPDTKSAWRKETINLTKALGHSQSFQLVFRNINNNDNNLYLDNIFVNEVALPDALKTAGYVVYPNPTPGVFYIRHYLPPMNLEAIQVVNASGRLITRVRYKANAPAIISIDLSTQSPGIYSVRLKYKEKMVTTKLIKL